jgi:glutamate-1-semialdehyde 2,1-aminomutase
VKNTRQNIHLNLTESLRIQKKAKSLIPGMTQLLSKRPDRFSYGVWPGYYTKAKGVKIWDLDGNEYIDMSIGGIGANVLGYADPEVDGAVLEAIGNGTSCSLNCPEELKLAELLCDLHAWAEMVRYARSGGEAMAIAVRIARAYTGRDKVAFCGYHGWHDWYLAANLGAKDALSGHLQSGLDPVGVPRALSGSALPFQYNDLDALEKIVAVHKDDLAAIIMEPVRNYLPQSDFLHGARALAEENGSVFIFDEISSGFRMNTGGAHLLYNVIPDIAVFSKALGNGYPIAAIIGISKVMNAAQKTFISSTNWTERIGPVAAIAMIKKHKRVNAGEYLVKLGKHLQNGLKSLGEKHRLSIDMKGIPPLTHFEFLADKALSIKALYVQLMLEKGFLASNLYYAMYAHTIKNVEDYLEAADHSFGEISEALAQNTVERKLVGDPAVADFKRFA